MTGHVTRRRPAGREIPLSPRRKDLDRRFPGPPDAVLPGVRGETGSRQGRTGPPS
ncbi:hypothetical protein [Streptomyces sp. Caat 7-52]|uniref:hypothetical protein n=1 Tax=Streptomyces sp. Caat 7-52 TaxID=2949637 RepID=UPI0020351F68|nr:hypothetical protein [Streptomyces sp. Caat 7-52]